MNNHNFIQVLKSAKVQHSEAFGWTDPQGGEVSSLRYSFRASRTEKQMGWVFYVAYLPILKRIQDHPMFKAEPRARLTTDNRIGRISFMSDKDFRPLIFIDSEDAVAVNYVNFSYFDVDEDTAHTVNNLVTERRASRS